MTEKGEKVTVFILNYNGIDEVRQGSAASMKVAMEELKMAGAEVSVVFLDNFSCDGSVELVKDVFPDATIATTFKNEGYVKGTNIGLQLAWKLYRPDYFIIVDSDNFTDVRSYRRLLEYVRFHPKAAIIQPVVKSRENHNQIISCGHIFNERGGTDSIKEINGTQDLDHLLSCSISSTLVRTEALLKTGLLNEAFEMYYESSDLSFRMRKSGYTCACCTDAVTYNERVSGFKLRDFRKYYLMRRNLFLFWYLNDIDRYFHYLDVWNTIRNDLQAETKSQTFITDYMKEAERRALMEAWQYQEYSVDEFLKIPGLDDFSRDSVCILQGAV